MTTTIQKWGNSNGIRIPKAILEQLGLDTNSNIIMTVSKDKLIIEKAAIKHKTLAERFADYTGEAPSGEYDWGEPQGEEIW